MALASNSINFVAPNTVRNMRTDLGYLPALWADDGDIILVNDVNTASNKAKKLKNYINHVTFVSHNDIKDIDQADKILPWGWDKALRFQLQNDNVPTKLLPTDEYLDRIRNISHRWWASQKLLKKLTEANMNRVGKALLISDIKQLDDIDYKYVIKAPWSSSGRGVRYVNGLTKHQQGWANNIIRHQGSLILEPYYHKIMDFAVEFYAFPDCIKFLGLSVFQTSNGAYTGNIIANEKEKQEIISQYMAFDQVQSAIDDICNILNDEMVGKFTGPFGIDMMIVYENGIKLHPCVELNLRHTMGHIALAIQKNSSIPCKLMQIIYNEGFHFRIQETALNCRPSVW